MEFPVSLEFARWYLFAYDTIIVLFTLLFVFQQNKQSYLLNKQLAPFCCLIIILFITFRPEVWQYFGDTHNYARSFRTAQDTGIIPKKYDSDPGFMLSIQLFKSFDLRLWFLFFATIYTVLQYVVCKKLFNENLAFAFVLIIVAFSFFSYGFNGMRNGAACALVMYAFICPSRFTQILLFIVAASLHRSVLLPIFAYIITAYYSNTRIYIYVWGICIFIAYFISGSFGDMGWLSDMLGDERVNYFNQNFTTMEGAGRIKFSHTGFRWDFLIYSAVPIYLGWITIVKNGIEDSLYTRLFNIYVLCNTAWLFTARLPFNNRFAYLSWFLLPLLMAYPFILNDTLRINSKVSYFVIFYLLFNSLI